MTKNEFLSQLKAELKKCSVADTDEITGEYEEHFAFKSADGFSEEEISARLGSPAEIAANYAGLGSAPNKGGSALIKIGLGFVAIIEILVYILFFAWVIAMAAAAIASLALGFALIFRLNIGGLIPQMSYFGQMVFGLGCVGMAGIFAVAAYYCFELLKQLVRASIRWHKITTNSTAMPPLPWNPQFGAKAKRSLRNILLWSVVLTGACFVLAYVILSLSAGSVEFWHIWGWFAK